ncbi:16133_t:CDS:1, partial [Racocetra fulgida]
YESDKILAKNEYSAELSTWIIEPKKDDYGWNMQLKAKIKSDKGDNIKYISDIYLYHGIYEGTVLEN